MQRDDYRATLIVIFGLAASTLTGFLRQASLAQLLGAGRVTDIYLIAFAIPEFVFIALPIVLTPAFLPLFAACRREAGEAAAWRFGGRTALGLGAFLVALTALAWLGIPIYVGWLSPGFSLAERLQAAQAERLMLPAVSLMGIATLLGTILQVQGRFARPALASALYNLVFMAALWGLPMPAILDRAAWGVTLGAAAALLFQLPVPRTFEAAVTAKPKASLAQVMRLAGPLAAGYAAHHLILFVDRAMATALGPGSTAALDYASRLAQVIGQLSGLAVATVLFPKLAEQISRGDLAAARVSLASALRFVALIALPTCTGLVVLRAPLVQVLFERGAFDRAATAAVSLPLGWYAVSILADALCQPLWRVIYAQRSAWTVLGVNSLQTAVRWLGNVILSGAFGYNGLALSAALGLVLQLLVLGWLVQRSLGPVPWGREAAPIVLATAAAAAGGYFATAPFARSSPLVILLAGGGVGGLIYLAWLLGSLYLRRDNDAVGSR